MLNFGGVSHHGKRKNIFSKIGWEGILWTRSPARYFPTNKFGVINSQVFGKYSTMPFGNPTKTQDTTVICPYMTDHMHLYIYNILYICITCIYSVIFGDLNYHFRMGIQTTPYQLVQENLCLSTVALLLPSYLAGDFNPSQKY